jgi:hypothetical protein
MATDHCENGLRFFSQWSGWVAVGFEARRKTGFVIGPGRKAKIETQRTLRTQRKTVRGKSATPVWDFGRDFRCRGVAEVRICSARGFSDVVTVRFTHLLGLATQGLCHLSPCVKKVVWFPGKVPIMCALS